MSETMRPASNPEFGPGRLVREWRKSDLTEYAPEGHFYNPSTGEFYPYDANDPDNDEVVYSTYHENHSDNPAS